MTIKNKALENEFTALYVGIYGILIQIISFSIIYLMSNYIIADSVAATTTTLIYIWYLFSIFALIPITLSVLQIRRRNAEGRAYGKPLAGFLVSTVWLLSIVGLLATGFMI